jgi:hypothetical protein
MRCGPRMRRLYPGAGRGLPQRQALCPHQEVEPPHRMVFLISRRTTVLQGGASGGGQQMWR